eukprot:3556827-Rhodomonas_salina.1
MHGASGARNARVRLMPSAPSRWLDRVMPQDPNMVPTRWGRGVPLIPQAPGLFDSNSKSFKPPPSRIRRVCLPRFRCSQ